MKEKIRSLIINTSLTVSVVIAVYMLLARFSFLTEPPIYDELFSMSTASPDLSFKAVWTTVLTQDVNLPLYNLLLRVWAHFVPFTVPFLRALSVLFSIGLIPLAWIAAPKTWNARKKTILCCLLSGSCILMAFSGLLRAYPLGILLCCIVSLLALRIVENLQTHTQPSRRLFFGFFALGLACAYTHYFSSALFFITALWLFIQALIYKTQRTRIFAATVTVFLLWIPWVITTYLSLDHFQADWWYDTSLISSSWQIIELLLGPSYMLAGTLFFVLIGVISVLFNEKGHLSKFHDVWMGLFQIGVLVLTLSIVSLRYNLWMSRYFLFFLPSLFIIFASLLTQLTKRNALFMILLPAALYVWMTYAWQAYQMRQEDTTGLQANLQYVASLPDVNELLVIYKPIDYKGVARDFVLNYYIPKGRNIRLLPMSQENAYLLKEQHVPLLVPLCSVVSLLEYSTEYGFRLSPNMFAHNGTCVIRL